MARSDRSYVEYDWADEDGDPYAIKFASKMGLNVEVVMLNGPGGGWPILGFSGPNEKIEALVASRPDEEATVIQLCDMCGAQDNGDIDDGLCADCREDS